MKPAVKFIWSGRLREIAEEAAKVLGMSLEADSVWLYGSIARNEENVNSDIDLLVVVPHSLEPRYRRAQHAHRLLSGIRAPKDVIVLTRAEFEAQLKVPASLPSAVLREGLQLYGS